MLRDTLAGLIEPMLASAGAHPSRPRCHPSGTEYRTIDPVCLENPRPDRGGTYTTENAPSPFHAEPRHQSYVDYYNGVRLHSAIGYVTPKDMLAGRQAEIHATRDRKLEQARRQRQLRRQQASAACFNGVKMPLPDETEAGSAGTQPC